MAKHTVTTCDEADCNTIIEEQTFDLTVGRDKLDVPIRYPVTFKIRDDIGIPVDMCTKCLFAYIEAQFDRILHDLG